MGMRQGGCSGCVHRGLCAAPLWLAVHVFPAAAESTLSAPGRQPSHCLLKGELPKSFTLTCSVFSGREFIVRYDRAENLIMFESGPRLPLQTVETEDGVLTLRGSAGTYDVKIRLGERPWVEMAEAGGRYTRKKCHKLGMGSLIRGRFWRRGSRLSAAS